MSSTVRRRRSIRGSFVKVGKKRPRKFDENTLAELAKLIPDDFVRAQLERERIRSRYAEEKEHCQEGSFVADEASNEQFISADDEAVDPVAEEIKIQINANVEAVCEADTLSALDIYTHAVTMEGNVGYAINLNKVYFYVPVDSSVGKIHKRGTSFTVVSGIKVDMKHYFHCSFCHKESDVSALIIRDSVTFAKLAVCGRTITIDACMHVLCLPRLWTDSFINNLLQEAYASKTQVKIVICVKKYQTCYELGP